MPPGLTAGLDKESFVNLVGFLSKMGESGKFRVPTARFVRRWSVVPASKELARNVVAEGPGYTTKDNAKVAWQPAYSKVSGDLPVDELPVVEVAPGKRLSFVRFDIEVVSKGNVNLVMNPTAGLSVWAGQKPLKLTDRGVTDVFSPGIHAITIAIDRNIYKDNALSIQLVDAENAPAQTRLVIGR